MADAHRNNVLVTSCLKAPVDPHTKAPLASYERERVLPYTGAPRGDNRDYEKELEYEDSGSDFCEEDYLQKGAPLLLEDCRAAERLDLREIIFSNEEYYSKLEELKRAHLRTMAELEAMYQRNLQLKAGALTPEARRRLPWSSSSPAASRRLRRSHSAVELRRSSEQSDFSDEEDGEAAGDDVEKGLLSSPKEHIKNMWRDFKVSPAGRPPSGDQEGARPREGGGKSSPWKQRVTVPVPFQMTLREAERRRCGVKTRSEIEHENAELRRQLEELTECRMKFRASPVPAHVHLPLYEELQEQNEERRRAVREQDVRNLLRAQKPFSFLERERLKMEDRQRRRRQSSEAQEKVKPFKARPVPKAVYTAASGEQVKEDQLYRSIKIQMRAREMLLSSTMPPSMLTERLNQRKKADAAGGGGAGAGGGGGDAFTHRPQINKEVPDFDASYKRFQRNLEKRKEAKSTTACEPFALRTSNISSHRERILAEVEKEQSSPGLRRWPHVGSPSTANSSLCSSLSGSLELLPAKVTDATKKRHEAVRQVLEQRRKAEEEEQRRRERQRQRERSLQREVLKRAHANDPHVALAHAHLGKLQEFRKQERQRRKEYQQEIRQMQRRVRGRPLLLEQVAQRNAKQAAEKRYADALHGCHLTEELVSAAAGAAAAGAESARKASASSDSRQSDQDELDIDYEAVRYRKVYLDDDDDDDDTEGGPEEQEEEEPQPASAHHSDAEDAGGSDKEDRHGDDRHGDDRRSSDDNYCYLDDHEDYSGDSEQESTRQEAGQ